MPATADTDWLGILAAMMVGRRLLPSLHGLRFEALGRSASVEAWAIHGADDSIVVKRPLASSDASAGARIAAEQDWLAAVDRMVPGAVPEILYNDPSADILVTTHVGADWAPLWAQLGRASPGARFAGAVGELIGQIHAASAGRRDLADRFAIAGEAHARRVVALFAGLASRHSSVAGQLRALGLASSSRRDCLIHAGLGPYTICVGPVGPILLGTERVAVGDAAFDLAFCLAQLLLGRVGDASVAAVAQALVQGYFEAAVFESRTDLEARIAQLLPALLLAGRGDGQGGPIGLLPSDQHEAHQMALRFIQTPVMQLAPICAGWANAHEGQDA